MKLCIFVRLVRPDIRGACCARSAAYKIYITTGVRCVCFALLEKHEQFCTVEPTRWLLFFIRLESIYSANTYTNRDAFKTAVLLGPLVVDAAGPCSCTEQQSQRKNAVSVEPKKRGIKNHTVYTPTITSGFIILPSMKTVLPRFSDRTLASMFSALCSAVCARSCVLFADTRVPC